MTRRLIILITLILSVFAPRYGQTASTGPVARLRAELEPRINDAIEQRKLPGLAIGVVKMVSSFTQKDSASRSRGKDERGPEYQDYRTVDGVKVPFIINQLEGTVFTIRLTEVKHNVAIDDAVFVKPKK